MYTKKYPLWLSRMGYIQLAWQTNDITLLHYALNRGNSGGSKGLFSGIAGVHLATRIGWEGVEHHAMSTHDDPADYCPQPARARCLTP